MFRFLLILTFTLSAGIYQAYASTYLYTDLGTLGGTSSSAIAINNTGQIVGSSQITGNTFNHAAFWGENGAAPIDLTPFHGNSSASSINDSGQIAGTIDPSTNIPSNGIRYAAGWYIPGQYAPSFGNPINLGVVDQANGASNASGINDAGKIVGAGQTADYYQHAHLWKASNELKDIGQGGLLVRSAASAINNSNQIVGWRDTELGSSAVILRAALWNANPGGSAYTSVLLGTLGGTNNYATAINDVGQIVGNSQTSTANQAPFHATLWSLSNGTYSAFNLDALSGAYSSSASAINIAGLVVGSARASANTASYATLWNGTTVTNLNSLLDPATLAAGWVLSSANDINDNGWIVGSASNTLTNETNAFLLEPIAAPILAGDFDLDGDVDGRDFLAWQSGASPNPLSEGDLADWQLNYGVPPSIANALVPEPKAFVILMGSFCILLSRPKQELRLT